MPLSREGFYNARSGRKLRGLKGKTILKVTNRESEHPDANDVVQHVDEREAVELVDHEWLHAGRTDPLVACGQCQRGRPKGWFHEEELPNHGLLLKENAHLCEAQGCGEYCCKKHVRWIDGQPWCVRCAERCDVGSILRGFLAFFRWVFFREEEV